MDRINVLCEDMNFRTSEVNYNELPVSLSNSHVGSLNHLFMIFCCFPKFIGRELDQKCSSQVRNQHPCGMQLLQAAALLAILQCCPPNAFIIILSVTESFLAHEAAHGILAVHSTF